MKTVQSILRAGAAIISITTSAAYAASPAPARSAITLAPATLEQSLNALSRQSGVQILYDPALLRGKKAPAVKGAASLEGALTTLLRPAGLSWQKRGNAVLIVQGGSAGNLAANETPPERRTGASTDTVAQTDEATAEAIVVTGSRIARPELESPMPVTVTDFAEARRFGRNSVIDALQLVPAIAPGSSNYDTGGASKTGYGIDAINLRNLGTNRSLALLDDQRRVSGAAASSTVNMKMIPAAMIDRIEVVTGGAAAIYGADAVTGAVNVITRKDFKGLNISAYQGISQYGDAPERNISLVTGGKSADGRARFILGGTYSKIGAVTAEDRDFSRKRLNYLANPANKGPSDGVPDQLLVRDFVSNFTSNAPTFYIANNKTSYVYCDNKLSPITYLRPFGAPSASSGGDGSTSVCNKNLLSTAVLRNKDETFSAIGKFEYDVSDSITYTARLEYGRIKAFSQETAYRDDYRTIFVAPYGGPVGYTDNPYMPASIRDLLGSFGLKSINIDQVYSNWPPLVREEDRESITIGQNLSGKITPAINWKAFYQWGRATDDITIFNYPLRTQLRAARDDIADPVTGQPICRDAAARAAGCVPINMFSRDPLSAEQKAYILANRRGREITKQQIFGGSMNGKIVTLPGGDAFFAIGAEHRKESAQRIEDPLALNGELSHSAAQWPVSAPFKATIKVTEAYGELVVPIIRDKPLLRRLEVEGAYRYSKYSTFGSTDTWKVGASWSPFAGMTIRGVRSRSVRVPNFGELYAPITSSGSGSQGDPCLDGNYNNNPIRAANCAALGITTPLPYYTNSLVVTGGGNPNLKPETSNSYTIGMVLQPRFLPRFDLTLDYWNIDIKNIITSYSVSQTANLCVDLPSLDNQFCPLITRDAQHQIVAISTQLLNAALMQTDGLDIGLNYRIPLGDGQLRFGVNASYLLRRKIQNIPGVASSIVKYAGGYTDPHFRGSLVTGYSNGGFDISLLTRFVGAAKYDPNAATSETYEVNKVPAMVYNDIAISRTFDAGLEMSAGIKNVLNTKPPLFPEIYTGASGRYDTIGRSFFVKVAKTF